MTGTMGLFAVLYVLIIVGVSIFILVLAGRFVKAVEKIADVLERKSNL